MKQQPDKLFREKLAGYSKPMPSGAWDKIESSLDKKNTFRIYDIGRKGLWLKIAASFLIMSAIVYALWPEKEEQPVANKTENSSVPSIVQEKQDDHEQAEEKNTPPVDDAPAKSNIAENKNSTLKNKRNDQPVTDSVVEDKPKLITEEKSDGLAEMLGNIPSFPSLAVDDEVIMSNIPIRPEEKNITLVFSAKEVDEYLNKKALAKATLVDEKSSTLKKLLKKAADLKNNQDPFGDLRQKKNEILALNFKGKEARSNR
jgi:hypothetical protein